MILAQCDSQGAEMPVLFAFRKRRSHWYDGWIQCLWLIVVAHSKYAMCGDAGIQAGFLVGIIAEFNICR
jgi:hypothetical protein